MEGGAGLFEEREWGEVKQLERLIGAAVGRSDRERGLNGAAIDLLYTAIFLVVSHLRCKRLSKHTWGGIVV